ncbi:MAG TPA: hypothetical protein VGA53_00810 [Candidatus Paceibacterota bacterium]
MKFQVNLSGKTLYSFMRQAGYAPAFAKATAGKPAGEFAFNRSLTGSDYPKFHIYATQNQNNTASLNLHLDQKKPSYAGSHAHSAEYDGQLVETEATRIQQLTLSP